MVKNAKTSIFTKDHLDQLDSYWDSLYKRSLSIREKILNRFLKDRRNQLDFIVNNNQPFYNLQITTGDLNIEDYGEVSSGFLNPIFVNKLDKAIKDIQSLISQFKQYVPDDNVIKQMLESQENYEKIQYEIIHNLANYIDIKIRIWGCTYDICADNLNIENLQMINNHTYTFMEMAAKFFNLTKYGTLHIDQELLSKEVIDENEFFKRFSDKQIEWRRILFENSIYYNEDPTCSDKSIKNMICGIQIAPNLNIFSKLMDNIAEDQKMIVDQVKHSCSSFELFFFGLDPLLIDSLKTYNYLTKI